MGHRAHAESRLAHCQSGFETCRRSESRKRRSGPYPSKWMTILNAAQEAASMGRRKKTKKRSRAKSILLLPDLEQSKNAVLNSLAAASSQESYAHAFDEFIGWYCSEPRLAFNRSVVLRYRFFLEQKNLARSTINVRLAAVRRLAFEAADTGLLSPELAAGIGRVKGAKRLGVSDRKLADRRTVQSLARRIGRRWSAR